jgi:hypothetical protein
VERRENSKKAARSLRTRTAGRSVSHAGRGETRFRAAGGLGHRGLVPSSAQENFRSARFYRRSSAFIGGQYGVFVFALDREKSTFGRCCDPAAQVALPESPLLCRPPHSLGRSLMGLPGGAAYPKSVPADPRSPSRAGA